MARTVTFSFSRNTSPGDITQSMKLVVTDTSNAVAGTINLAPSATTGVLSLPVANGYMATLTAYSGPANSGQPCLSPAVQVFDVLPPPPPPVPGDPALSVPVVS